MEEEAKMGKLYLKSIWKDKHKENIKKSLEKNNDEGNFAS